MVVGGGGELEFFESGLDLVAELDALAHELGPQVIQGNLVQIL
jgi:hypothetical protein